MAELSNIARPYAQAVFDLARESGDFQRWSEQLDLLSAIVDNADVAQVIADPRVSREDVLQIVLDIGGEQLGEQARNLVRVLSHYRRLSVMAAITRQYEALRAEAEGVVAAELETAFPMDDEHGAIVAQALEEKLERKVRLQSTVNEDLIGGAIIRAGDWVIDGSVRARLTKLASSLGV